MSNKTRIYNIKLVVSCSFLKKIFPMSECDPLYTFLKSASKIMWSYEIIVIF